MGIRRYIVSSVLLLCVVLVVIFYPTDEKRIKKIITRCEEAVVTENLDELMSHVSYNYLDDYGNGYLQIKNIMQTAFQYLDDIEVEKDIIKILVKEHDAEAHLSVRVLASQKEDRGYIVGDAGRAQKIKVFLEKPVNRWLVTKVEGLFDDNNQIPIPSSK